MKTIKTVIKGLTPPYVVTAAKQISRYIPPKSNQRNSLLFDGDSQEFTALASKAQVYFEYGCGNSTAWVSHNTKAKIFSVDTSKEWIENTRSKLSKETKAHLQWVNCGPVGEWGTPINYCLRQNFSSYISGPFAITSETPDLILIDGRFRVACFLNALRKSKPGSVIIFDDYKDRPHYHVAEEFCPDPSFCGRQAIFKVPPAIDFAKIDREIDRFSYVLS